MRIPRQRKGICGYHVFTGIQQIDKYLIFGIAQKLTFPRRSRWASDKSAWEAPKPSVTRCKTRPVWTVSSTVAADSHQSGYARHFAQQGEAIKRKKRLDKKKKEKRKKLTIPSPLLQLPSQPQPDQRARPHKGQHGDSGYDYQPALVRRGNDIGRRNHRSSCCH